MKVNGSNSTKSVETIVLIQTREQIYRCAIEKFKRTYPKYDAVTLVSMRLGIGVKMLYAILEGNRYLSVVQQDSLFRECNFPEGFDLLKQINFTKPGV